MPGVVLLGRVARVVVVALGEVALSCDRMLFVLWFGG